MYQEQGTVKGWIVKNGGTEKVRIHRALLIEYTMYRNLYRQMTNHYFVHIGIC
jgi:hypothetical protein